MALSILIENLRRLRVQRDLSQEELANKAGISRLAYSNIETGKAEPRSSTLQSIADALGVPLLDLITESPKLQQVRFRAAKKLHREHILAMVSSWLSDRISIENLLGKETATSSFQAFIEKYGDVKLSPKDAAKRVRDAWGLSDDAPISDICGRIERWGVRLFPHPFHSDRFFGLAIAPDGGGPAIVVNIWDRISVERWIFSAAHELGHLILHRDAFQVDLEEEVPTEEREANEFAGHLLMPDGAFSARWNESGDMSLIERILKIKRLFLVSWKTVAFRLCEHHHQKTADIWKACYTGFQRMGLRVGSRDEVEASKAEAFSEQMRADEPANLLAHDFVPPVFGGAQLRNMVLKAIDEEKISVARAAEILKTDIPAVRSLYDDWCNEDPFLR